MKIFAVLGMFLFVFVTYLMSDNKDKINWKSVGMAFFGQIILALILIKTPVWKGIEIISRGVEWVIAQSVEGVNFVFGGLTENYVFFLNALLPIVFISSIMGLLFHFGILQKFILVVGKLVARVLKVDTLIAVNGITNMFMGQSDSLFVTKSYLPNSPPNISVALFAITSFMLMLNAVQEPP